MRKKQIFEIGTRLENAILHPANAPMGQALVVLGAGRSSDRRLGAAVRTAHDNTPGRSCEPMSWRPPFGA